LKNVTIPQIVINSYGTDTKPQKMKSGTVSRELNGMFIYI